MRKIIGSFGALAAMLALVPGTALAEDALADGSHAEAGSSAVALADQASHVDAHTAGHDMAASILPNVGNGGFAITTAVPQAQAFFDNGMALLFAFSHEQATNAMAEAVRLDPACAMCRWGHALSLGPNLNMDVDADERRRPRDEMREAARLVRKAGTAKERALIDALSLRFQPGKVVIRDRAYADEMAKLAARWPEDDSLQVLAADALMVATDWEKPDMTRPIALIEPVLARNPDHTGAIHFYIHATEIAGTPGKAEEAADRLDAMRLQATHLVHMPSHTWYWVGRYQNAADANRRAVVLGEHQAMAMHGKTDGGEVWDMPYHAHNVIFGLGGALMSGDSRTALMLGRPLVEHAQARTAGSPVNQLLSAAGYFALARFEDPRVVLALPEPKLPYLAAARRYARGEALAYLGDIAGVKSEIEAIPAVIAAPKKGTERYDPESTMAAEQMLSIVRSVLTGRVAMMEGRFRDAATAFEQAATIEKTKDFSEFSDPPAFWYPVRRDLAAALEAAGDKAGALIQARRTLEIRPRDPVASEIVTRLSQG